MNLYSFTCIKCNKRYTATSNLSRHYKNDHRGFKPQRKLSGPSISTCEICGKGASTKESFRKHRCKPR
jgi:hypothetical protein